MVFKLKEPRNRFQGFDVRQPMYPGGPVKQLGSNSVPSYHRLLLKFHRRKKKDYEKTKGREPLCAGILEKSVGARKRVEIGMS
jgi:hypothetical protein